MPYEMLKLLPAGLIPAALVLYVLFRELGRRDSLIGDLTASFLKRQEDSETRHRQDVHGMIARYDAAQRATAKQQREVIDDYIDMTKETIEAVKGLEIGFRELSAKIAEWYSTPDPDGTPVWTQGIPSPYLSRVPRDAAGPGDSVE